ncbi:MAG: ROK family protein [Saprospiraceae bacterium]|jgi:polyphosphate glucokinase
MSKILGIDVGGSGVKGALVDLKKGSLSGERFRVPTPKPATPKAVGGAIREITEFFNYKGLIGCGFPAIVKDGRALTASNIHSSWINTSIEEAFSKSAKGSTVYATNDADAAGLAEMRFGAGKDNMGLVLLITIGTGIGTAMFYKGELIPNTEFGHVIWKNKKPAEAYCSSGARERLKISRKEWARRFNDYLHHLERILSPDLFILGGGESKLFDSYKQHLNPNCPVVPAQLLNNAGIIGAAVYASEIA